jgi:hypothetical protein
MDEKELLNYAMYNSYNVITHKCTVEDIEDDGMPIFIHYPDTDIDKASIKVMMIYFIMTEEYEKCEELSKEYELLFHEKMPKILCECRVPSYHLFDDDTIECKNCKIKIV